MMDILNRNRCTVLLLCLICSQPVCDVFADDQRPHNFPIGKQFSATDTLGAPADPSTDAMACLQGLCWQPEPFLVRCEATDQDNASAVLRFPSPRPVGNAKNDQVAVEWYAVTDDAGRPVQAPAIVVVHESGRRMTVGRMVARGLRDRGLHAFMVQLPFYGLRRPAGARAEDQEFAKVMSQGIADVRRTLDAVRCLPYVKDQQVHLQGTSLGGFVAATTSGIDAAFQNVFVLLAGGDLPKLIMTGERETAALRRKLQDKGYQQNEIFELLNRFEPNRLAHRIPTERLWVYSGNYDTVVPPAHSESFAKANGLPDQRHIRMPATHYSGILFLPLVLDQIATDCGGHSLLPAASIR